MGKKGAFKLASLANARLLTSHAADADFVTAVKVLTNNNKKGYYNLSLSGLSLIRAIPGAVLHSTRA